MRSSPYFGVSYAFESPEKVALQEIGPRFTLKLRWLKKGIPVVYNYGEAPVLPQFYPILENAIQDDIVPEPIAKQKAESGQDKILWAWKVSGFCSFVKGVNLFGLISLAGVGDF